MAALIVTDLFATLHPVLFAHRNYAMGHIHGDDDDE